MSVKPKISPNGTYILDPEDIEQLDEFSLTSVIADAVESFPQERPESAPSDTPAADAGDTTINRILEASQAPDDQPPVHRDSAADSDATETTSDLLNPKLMFPE